MKRCTWVDCDKKGVHEIKAKDGEIWAILCDEHHNKMNDILVNGSALQIIGVWIKAQGGAKKAANRI